MTLVCKGLYKLLSLIINLMSTYGQRSLIIIIKGGVRSPTGLNEEERRVKQDWKLSRSKQGLVQILQPCCRTLQFYPMCMQS